MMAIKLRRKTQKDFVRLAHNKIYEDDGNEIFFRSDSNITQPIASGEVDETPPDSFYQKSHFSASLSNKTSPTS